MGCDCIRNCSTRIPMGIDFRRAGFFVASLVFSFLALTGSAHAESITSSQTSVVITNDGMASFREEIAYQYTDDRHGIFRDIPYVGKLPDGQYMYFPITNFSATRNGAPERFSQSTVGSDERFKIGDPDIYVNGSQNYVLSYELGPIVRREEQGDYLTVNLYGPKWPVAASTVAGTIRLPAGVQPSSIVCYTGRAGSRASDCRTEQLPDGTIRVTSNGFVAASEGLTTDIVVPKNSFTADAYVQPTTEAPPSDNSGKPGFFDWLMLISIVGGLIYSIVYGVILIQRKIAKTKRQKAQTIIPEYDAPKGMTPGDIGLIADEQADAREITATVIDLARRGYLTIHYETQKKFFGSKERFLLKKTSKTTGMASYETALYHGLFGVDKASVYIDELQPTSMAVVVESVKKILETRLKDAGLFAQKQRMLSPDNLTQEGYKVWAKVEGLKLYLNVAEKDRMKFAEAPEKTPERFTKLLPYAIALGVEKEWAKQFDGIDVSPATEGWYYGSRDMSHSIVFANVLSNSFATSLSTHVTPPSSGGSGGGFSGGGVGGGGGGSW